jgi:hypothetical protein
MYTYACTDAHECVLVHVQIHMNAQILYVHMYVEMMYTHVRACSRSGDVKTATCGREQHAVSRVEESNMLCQDSNML